MTAEQWLTVAAAALAGYLCGSIPFGVLIARSKGVDLRRQGSGNVGATNVGRVLGKKLGYLCFVLDVLKGLGPVLIAGLLLRPAQGPPPAAAQLAWLAAGLGAILGHVFPVWLKFRGGKGVATSLGVVLGFWPYLTVPGLAAFALWIAVTLIWRYVSLGSIVAAGAFGPMLLGWLSLRGDSLMRMLPLVVFALAMCLLVIVRHRTNIKRLLAGTENKIGTKPEPGTGNREQGTRPGEPGTGNEERKTGNGQREF